MQFHVETEIQGFTTWSWIPPERNAFIIYMCLFTSANQFLPKLIVVSTARRLCLCYEGKKWVYASPWALFLPFNIHIWKFKCASKMNSEVKSLRNVPAWMTVTLDNCNIRAALQCKQNQSSYKVWRNQVALVRVFISSRVGKRFHWELKLHLIGEFCIAKIFFWVP